MAKAYFTLAGLFDDVKYNTGKTVKLDLQSIKVDGVEQLTADYFTEVIPAFVNPHTANAWSFATCTQTGNYPNTTNFGSCAIGSVPNSFNPFASTWQVVYSDVVDSQQRGEIVGSISGNPYGLEQFEFGFDLLDLPINDIVGGGSTGASVKGAFYLDIDYTKDFEMIIQVTQKDALGNIVSDKKHVYNHQVVNCSFDYEIIDGGYIPVSDTYFWTTPTGNSQWSFVDGGNGYAYSAAGRSGYFLKLDLATGLTSTFGSFTSGVAPQYTQGILNPSNGKIYFMPYDSGALDVLVLDTSNDSYYTFGSFTLGVVPNPFDGLAITATGIIYASSTLAETFFKIDTNLETVTTLNKVGANGAGVAEYSTNGFVYFVSNTQINKLDTSTDIITTISEPAISSPYASYIDTNGIIYAMGGNNNFILIETLSGDTLTTIPTSSPNLGFMRNISKMSDNNAYSIDVISGIVYKLDTTLLTVSEVYTISKIYAYLPTTQIGDSIYAIPNGVDEEILKLTFDLVINTYNRKQSAFLSGGLSGWIIPNCIGGATFNNSPIVTQAIGIVAAPLNIVQNIFSPSFVKQCCYFSPVFAHPVDTDSWKNDYNSFLFKRNFSSETIDLVLLKNGGAANGGTDIPLIDNTYGEYANFGFAGTSNLKGYKIEWQKVLIVEGEGSYQLQATSNFITGTEVQTSLVFKLKSYTEQAVKGTVKIESNMKGYLKHLDFNFGQIFNGWDDSIRVKGFFGNRQAEYEQEQIIYQNRTSQQLRSEMINTYTLQTLHIPSCVTDLIIEYHNFANFLYITDYNTVNHKEYIRKKVVFDAMDEIEYKSVTSNAPLVCKYKDYVQNYQKSNC